MYIIPLHKNFTECSIQKLENFRNGNSIDVKGKIKHYNANQNISKPPSLPSLLLFLARHSQKLSQVSAKISNFCFHFLMIYACHRQTDRQTDRRPSYYRISLSIINFIGS
jgi:hypothetical protein